MPLPGVMTHPLPCHGRFVLNTYSNKNKWLDIFRRVTNGNNKQKQIVSNEWHGIPGIRNNELRLEQIYRGYHATIIAEVLDGGVQDRLRDHGEKTLRYTPASVPGARQTMCVADYAEGGASIVRAWVHIALRRCARGGFGFRGRLLWPERNLSAMDGVWHLKCKDL